MAKEKSPNSTLNQVKQICRLYNIRPERSKGQNFLINSEILEKIAAAAEIDKDDMILEVGPGLGILTEILLKLAKKVVSVELDKKLFAFLKTKFVGIGDLDLINADILEFNPTAYRLPPTSYKIVANLPYNITSHFLKKFLTTDSQPKEMTLLLQKEVAQRICAKPGKMSLLAISVQLYGKPQIIEYVSRNNFWPEPEVDSAIIKISEIKSHGEVNAFLQGISEKDFWRLVKIGFSAKRKQLQHNLAAGLRHKAEDIKKSLNLANLDEKIRAENLSLNDWINLAKILNNHFN